MRWPFITRAHHEDIVTRMRDQIMGLAMRLYPEGVPKETQLVLGIHMEVPAQSKAAEPELTEDEKAIAEMKAAQVRDWAQVQRIKRTRPSQLGLALSDYMSRWGYQRPGSQNAAPSPAIAIFAQAEAEALDSTEA